MKNILLSFLACTLLSTSVYADDSKSKSTASYYTNLLGNASADATATAIGVSMLGWGVGIAAFVTAITILIPADNDSSSHTHCDPSS